jgi:hypothetical protein
MIFNPTRRIAMTRRYVAAVTLMVLLAVGTSIGQLSGYLSHTQTSHQNPLFNYDRLSDRLSETYCEFSCTRDFGRTSLMVRYTGGLLIFDRFTARNSYEHNALAILGLSFPSSAATGSAAADDAGDAGDGASEDSIGRFLDIGLGYGARHDKDAFNEFDNTGAKAYGSYRFHVSTSLVARLTVPVEYRTYAYLDVLSHILSGASLEVRSSPAGGWVYGIVATFGYKHFTSGLLDTSLFETTMASGNKGKGKGSGKVSVSKKILVNSQSRDVAHLGFGGSCSVSWSNGSAGVDFSYALRPGSAPRYLAQSVSTEMLTEDLYNDHFSYEGPTLALRCDQGLPAGIRSLIQTAFQRKQYGAPALDLDGAQTADSRVDLRGSCAVTLSKPFAVGKGVALELSISAQAGRNMSNDMYNDFSYALASGSLSISF